MRKIKRFKYIKIFFLVCIASLILSCITYPTETILNIDPPQGKIDIPNLDGYVTLKGDFHIHTILSDGQVTYKDRIAEASREGLDVLAVTDHNHHRFFPNRIPIIRSRDTLWASAQAYAEEKNIILVKGLELTRMYPPGHFCAIFLTDLKKINHLGIMGNLRAAKAQNAFITWNHLYQYDRFIKDENYWRPVHSKMLEEGLIHGIEINRSSRDIAFKLSREKELTIIGSTDRHGPMRVFTDGDHRAMTLIFARDKSPQAVYEALMERRTAHYENHIISGEETYLKELFEKAIRINVRKTGNAAHISLKNNSDLIFNLSIDNADGDDPNSIILGSQSETSIAVRLNDTDTNTQIKVLVNNFFIGPGRVMEYTL